MYKFFTDLENVSDKNITITGSDVNHIKNVLRMKTGDKILVSTGTDLEYCCVIAKIDDKKIILDIEDSFTSQSELPVKIYLFQGLPKSDKMELIIQKAVELGAYEIVPVATKYAVVKLDNKKAMAKVKRWNGISESAAKQSKRTIIPKVNDVMDFKEAMRYAQNLDMIMVPYEAAENMEYTRCVVESAKQCKSIGVFIGPEGGFAEEEIKMATDAGARAITLGKRILRTETAGLTTLSILMYTLEQ